MNQPWGRRAVGPDHDDSPGARDDASLTNLWLAADPVPPDIAEAAKAAFARHREPTIVLPVILDVRAQAPTEPDASLPIDLMVFGDGQSPLEVAVEVEREDRTVELRCTVRNAPARPSTVTIQSAAADHPTTRTATGAYVARGLPAGPVRVAVDFATSEATTVTTWFTA